MGRSVRLWSGYPRDWHNPEARATLPEIRRLAAKQTGCGFSTVIRGWMIRESGSFIPLMVDRMRGHAGKRSGVRN
ncbi:hypothetical protein FE781_14250 [Paenibacillus thermoaerophilus]|nr:hypothetical protein FE781_14250 [Paenibacillus thermoaerophilus]